MGRVLDMEKRRVPAGGQVVLDDLKQSKLDPVTYVSHRKIGSAVADLIMSELNLASLTGK